MIPNIITGFRIALILPILAIIGKCERERLQVAAVLFLVAVATDMLDGQAARRLDQQSTFGSIFDLVADRLLMTPVLIWVYGRHLLDSAKVAFNPGPGIYVLIIVIADLTVLLGITMFVRLRKKQPDIVFPMPTYIVKAAYPAQAAVVFFALLDRNPVVTASFMWIASILTVAAFISYMKKGGFVFRQGLKELSEEAVQEISGASEKDSNDKSDS